MRFLLLVFALNAHAQQSSLETCVAAELKANGAGSETSAFFHCRGIQLAKDFPQEGQALDNLRTLRDAWVPGSHLRYIDSRHDSSAISYSAQEDAYTVYLSDAQPIPTNLSREANEDHSVMRKISQQTHISLKDQVVGSDQLNALDAAFANSAFEAQGGMVIDIDFTLPSYVSHPFATLVERGMILHLRSSNFEVGHLMRFLASPKPLIDWLDQRKISLVGSDFFDSQIDFINKLKEADIPLAFSEIDLVASDSPRAISGACTSVTDCSGLKLILTDDPPAGTDGLDQDFLGKKLVETLGFFTQRKVSIPHEISAVTYANLRSIIDKWADNLRIRKIDLTRDDNSIEHAGFSFLGGQYTRIHLNDSKPFNNYAQLIGHYAFEK